MSIAFRSKASGFDTDGGVTVTKPSGVVDDDAMIALVWWRSDTSTLTATGWTEVVNLADPDDPTATGMQISVLRKKASSEGASYDFSESSASVAIGVAIAAWSGVDTTTMLDATGSVTNDTSELTSHVASAITTNTANTMVLALYAGNWGDNTWTFPSGMTERVDDSSGAGSHTGTLHIAEVLQASAGTTGTKTATSTAGIFCFNVLVALKEASAGTTIPIFMNSYRQRRN